MRKMFIAAIAVFSIIACAEQPAPFPEWGKPRAVTSGPYEHLLASYYGINSWSPNNRYVSVLRTDLNGMRI